MNNISLQPLPLADADEDARRSNAVVDPRAGVPRRVSSPHPAASALEAGPLVALVKRLEQRVEVLEAELVPLHRSRKCPCCHRLSLAVIASRPHPEFSAEGIEQHDVRCGCGYHASRLYDPRDFLR